jgi:hypothetical protein
MYICVLDITGLVTVEYFKHQSKVSFLDSTTEGVLDPAASPHWTL